MKEEKVREIKRMRKIIGQNSENQKGGLSNGFA